MFGAPRRVRNFDSDQMDTDRMVEYIASVYGYQRSRSNSPTQRSPGKSNSKSRDTKRGSPYDDETTDLTDYSRAATDRKAGRSKSPGFMTITDSEDFEPPGRSFEKPTTSIFKADNGTKELELAVNKLQTKIGVYEEILGGLSEQVSKKAAHLTHKFNFSKSGKTEDYKPLVSVYKEVLKENERLKSSGRNDANDKVIDKQRNQISATTAGVKVEEICTHLQSQIDVYVDLQNNLARTRVSYVPDNNRNTTVEFGMLKDIEAMLDRIQK